MAKRKAKLKKVLIRILLVILWPLVLIGLAVRFVSKRARYRLYLKNRISGRNLVMTTTAKDLENMEDFEIDDFFKYLFFYQGFTVRAVKGVLFKHCVEISKDGKTKLVLYDVSKVSNKLRLINTLKKAMNKTGVNEGFFIPIGESSELVLEMAQKFNIEIIQGLQLQSIIEKTVEYLKSSQLMIDEDSGKSVDQLFDEMYPNKI